MNRTTHLFVFLIVISFIFPATAIRYAQAAHTAAYMIGFNAGKGDGLNGVNDIGDTCSTDYQTSIKTITDSKNCTTGYDAGWNNTCHIGLTKFPNTDYSCPGFTQSQIQKMYDEKYHPQTCPDGTVLLKGTLLKCPSTSNGADDNNDSAQAASTTVITNQPNAKTFTCTDPTGKNLFCHPRIYVTTNFVPPKNTLNCKDADNQFKCTYTIIHKKGTHTPTAVLLDVYVTPKDKQLLYENKIKVVSFFVTKLVVKVIHEHQSNGKVMIVAIVEKDHNNRPNVVVINCFAPCLQQEYSRAVLKPIPIANDNQISDIANKVNIINCVVPSVGGPAGIACDYLTVSRFRADDIRD